MPRSIPFIDWAGRDAADAAARRSWTREIAAACRETGFFYLGNHGIPDATLGDQLAWAARFFAQPLSARQALLMQGSLRGYEPLRHQALDETAPPDLKESFYYSAGDAAQPWPEGAPRFRAAMEAYWRHVARLGAELFAGLALSLDLPADYFADGIAEPSCTVRLLHYPPRPAHAASGQLGAGAHTDWGAVTILLQDDCGGLEIRHPDGAWIDAAPVAGTLVINLGDMVPRWTNGRYRSATHRVVIKHADRDRYSVAAFFNPRSDYRVACVPTCLPASGVPLYAPCTVGEHVAEMALRTYGAGGERRPVSTTP